MQGTTTQQEFLQLSKEIMSIENMENADVETRRKVIRKKQLEMQILNRILRTGEYKRKPYLTGMLEKLVIQAKLNQLYEECREIDPNGVRQYENYMMKRHMKHRKG